MVVVTGKLAFKDILRDFTQVFVLSELRCAGKTNETGVKKVVFYVRSEVLTIHSDEDEEVEETDKEPTQEPVKEPVNSSQPEAKTTEKKEVPAATAAAEPHQEERRPRYISQSTNHADEEGESSEERLKERKPLFEMYVWGIVLIVVFLQRIWLIMLVKMISVKPSV